MRDVELHPPPPGAHQRGTLTLLRTFEEIAGGNPYAEALYRWLERPEAIGKGVPRNQYGLKYDAYLTRGSGTAWGLTVNDRYEGRASLEAATERLIAELPGTYDLSAAAEIERRFGHPGASTTIAVGFDHPDRPPRLKVYLQEETWGTGIAPLKDIVSAPDWIADARAGVVTLGLLSDGTMRVKAYLGGADPHGLVAGGPAELGALADAMAAGSPMGDGWYYLTIRLGAEPRYAVNKIYNAVQLGFTRDGAGIEAAWADVRGLFDRAGQAAELDALRAALPAELTVVPTATAIEDGGRSVDVYCAAWSG